MVAIARVDVASRLAINVESHSSNLLPCAIDSYLSQRGSNPTHTSFDAAVRCEMHAIVDQDQSAHGIPHRAERTLLVGEAVTSGVDSERIKIGERNGGGDIGLRDAVLPGETVFIPESPNKAEQKRRA